jgi:hydrogenase small subunit
MTTRMPEYGPLGNVDKIGAAMAVGTAAGVAVHGAMSVVQKQKREAEEHNEE